MLTPPGLGALFWRAGANAKLRKFVAPEAPEDDELDPRGHKLSVWVKLRMS